MTNNESPGTITVVSSTRPFLKNKAYYYAYSEVGDQEEVTPEGFQMLLPKEPKCSNEGWIGESCFCCGCTGYDTNGGPDDEGIGSAAEQEARYPLPQMEDTSGGGAQRASCELNEDSLPMQGPDQ